MGSARECELARRSGEEVQERPIRARGFDDHASRPGSAPQHAVKTLRRCGNDGCEKETARKTEEYAHEIGRRPDI